MKTLFATAFELIALGAFVAAIATAAVAMGA
jgi:hypothetical protein